jgi:regulatory protein
MLRRVYRSAHYHGTDLEEGVKIIDELIGRYIEAGLLDDGRFAEARVDSLYRRGISARRIRSKLAEKGVSNDIITKNLQRLEDKNNNPELVAGMTFARRRRLGPYRVSLDRLAFKVKDIAALARAGFNYNTAQKIIDAETVNELEEEVEKNIYDL